MKRFLTNQWIVISIAIFCSILWGSAFPALKVSYIELNLPADDPMAKVVFAGIRFFLAGLILIIGMLMINRTALLVTRRQFMVLILFGFIQTALQYFFFYNGLANTTGIQGAILTSSGTFFTVLLAHYFYVNDKMSWQKTIGLLAGFTGIIVANWGQGLELSFSLTGEGFMIIAALTNAIGTIMAKELAVGIHPVVLTGWQLSFGGLMMLGVGIPTMDEGAITFTPFGIGLLIYLALISAIAFALWVSLLKYNKAGELSIYKLAIPISGVFLSTAFIPGETLTWLMLCALMLVVIGFIAVNYNKKPKLQQKVVKEV